MTEPDHANLYMIFTLRAQKGVQKLLAEDKPHWNVAEEPMGAGAAILKALDLSLLFKDRAAFMEKYGFPDRTGKKDRIDPLPRAPKSKPIVFEGETIGMVLGAYTHEQVVGITTPAAWVPRLSFVYTIACNARAEEIGKVPGADIARLAKIFGTPFSKARLDLKHILYPDFYNDRNWRRRLYVFKKMPLWREDERLILKKDYYPNYPCGMHPGFTPRRYPK